VRSYEFSLTIYSGREIRDCLAQAGFVAVTLHGGFAGGPYGLDSERLVAVARKGR
jgi:hypothetical protein